MLHSHRHLVVGLLLATIAVGPASAQLGSTEQALLETVRSGQKLSSAAEGETLWNGGCWQR